MRSQTIGSCTIIYPDAMLYIGDNNYIYLSANGSKETTLRVTLGGKVVRYSSELDNVAVEIGSLLRQNDVYGSVSLQVYFGRTEPVYSNTLTLDFYVCRGRTLPTRYHGSPRRAILPYGKLFEVAMVMSGTIETGSQSISVAEPQIVGLTMPMADFVSVNVGYDDESYFGDFYNAVKTSKIDYNVEIISCVDDSSVVLQWYDSDGCKRYVVGKILSRRASSESVEYSAGGEIVRNMANRVIASVGEVWQIGISGVTKDLYLGEMAMSEEIWLENFDTFEHIPVILDGDIEIDERKTNDIVLKFKTLI